MKETVIYGLGNSRLVVRSDNHGLMLAITDPVACAEGVAVVIAKLRGEDRATLVNACLGVAGTEIEGNAWERTDISPTGHDVARTDLPEPEPEIPPTGRAWDGPPVPVALVAFQYVMETHLNTTPLLWGLDQVGRLWHCNPDEPENGWAQFPMPLEPGQ